MTGFIKLDFCASGPKPKLNQIIHTGHAEILMALSKLTRENPICEDSNYKSHRDKNHINYKRLTWLTLVISKTSVIVLELRIIYIYQYRI